MRDGRALVRADRRAELEHLAAEARDQPLAAARGRDRLEHRPRRRLVVGPAVVEADRERLSLDVVPVDAVGEGLEPLAPGQRLGLELEAVLADVDQLVEPDDPARVVARPAADAGDERVAAMQPAQLLAGRLRHGSVARHVDDRCEDAVDVEQDRRPFRLLGEPCEQ